MSPSDSTAEQPTWLPSGTVFIAYLFIVVTSPYYWLLNDLKTIMGRYRNFLCKCAFLLFGERIKLNVCAAVPSEIITEGEKRMKENYLIKLGVCSRGCCQELALGVAEVNDLCY